MPGSRRRYADRVTDKLDAARLDALWDFSDPDASAERFAAELSSGPVAAAELLTQRARALGLAGHGEEADALLASIEPIAPVVAIRLALERGRRLNSDGHPDQAVPFFTEALDTAVREGEDFLAVDAAHMLAIADGERSAEWAQRGIRMVAETTDARTRRWAIALHNNLGWYHHDAGRFVEALEQFELAKVAAHAHGSAQQQQWAQEAIDETLTAQRQSGA